MLVRGGGVSVNGKVEVQFAHVRGVVRLGFGLASQRSMEDCSLGRGPVLASRMFAGFCQGWNFPGTA